jgi:hypothetical protein
MESMDGVGGGSGAGYGSPKEKDGGAGAGCGSLSACLRAQEEAGLASLLDRDKLILARSPGTAGARDGDSGGGTLHPLALSSLSFARA